MMLHVLARPLSPRLMRLELLLVALVLCAVFVSAINRIPFHSDESHWIYSSQYFETFATGDFSAQSWNTYWSTVQPYLPRYLIAVSRLVGGYHVADLNLPWQFVLSDAQNIAEGRRPSPGLLWWSRLSMALLAAMSGLGFFAALRAAAGRVPAYLVVAFYALNLYYMAVLPRAMSEAVLLFCVILAILIGRVVLTHWRVYADNPSARTLGLLLMSTAGLGAASGAAGASKLNGLVLIPASVLLLMVAALVYRGRLSQSRRALMMGGLALWLCGASLLVFVGSDPFLYRDPVSKTRVMFDQRNAEMAEQVRSFPRVALTTGSRRASVFAKRLFQDYAPLRFPGAVVINSALTILGLAWLVRTSYDWMRQRNANATAMVLLILGAAGAAPTLATPLDWDRYYLLLLVFLMLCEALGVGMLVRLAGQAWKALAPRFRQAIS